MAQTAAHAHPKRRRAGRLPLVLLLVTFLTVGGVLIYFAVSAAGKPISAPVPEAPFDVGAPTDPGASWRLRQRICRRTRSRFPIWMCEPTS